MTFGETDMKLDDVVITKTIVESFCKKFLEYSETDVAIAGGGPAALCTAYFWQRKSEGRGL